MLRHLVHRAALASVTASLFAAAGTATVAAAQAAPSAAHPAIPSSIRDEHREIHDELVRATRLTGASGEAARALAAVLGPHFEREEQIALPPLALLVPLTRASQASVPAWVLPMTDSLRRELPKMLREHQAIRAATARLASAARSERRLELERFTEKLALHARTEEEVLYPAAVLVGDLVRARSARR